MHTLRLLAIFACLTMLASCGGGGGGGGSSSSGGSRPPPIARGAFTLSTTSASFAIAEQGSTAASQLVDITLTGADTAFVGAAYVAGQTPASWISINITGSGTAYRMSLNVSTFMTPGQYSTTFAVGTADAAGAVLQQQNFTVQVRVYSHLTIVGAAPISRTYVFGDASRTDTITMNVQGPERPWSVFSDVPWIHVPPASQTGAQNATATIDITGLAPGMYTGVVGARDNADGFNGLGLAVTIFITAPTFSAAQSDILFGGTHGDEALAVKPINFSLATGAGVHPYTATASTDSGGDWLQVGNPTGMVGAAGATVNLSVAPGTLVAGTRTAELHLSTVVYGITYTTSVPVTWNREANRLVVSTTGVGLSRLPGRDVLTRTIKVFSAARRDGTPWAAQSDSPWLSVTPSGTTDGNLTLTANPTGLALNTTHIANVSVSSPDAMVENTQSIRVGLYISATAPVATSFPLVSSHLAASPVEPLVAISGGGGTDVRIYNVYTGALVRTLTNVAAAPAAIKWNGDGTQLLVHDTTNLNVRAVNPVSGAQLASFDATSISDTYIGHAIDVGRPNGYEIVITPGGKIYDLATGAYYANSPYFSAVLALSFAHSPDQRIFSPQFGYLSRFTRTALRGGGLEIEALNLPVAAYDGGEACFNESGDRIYTTLPGNPDSFSATSLATGQVVQQLPAGTYPSSVRCLWNGLIVGALNYPSTGHDILTYYGPTGVARGTLDSDVGGIYQKTVLRRGLAESADGTRIISLYADYAVIVAEGVTMQTLPVPQ
jgi:hypothetical protein